jgi:8-oxo-dGTP pyrophosphatase MutT (NUDIX family)
VIGWLRLLFGRPPVLQVAMACLRDSPDGPEILMVRTRGSGRWILPKGWPMKGRTLAEAAAQEAWEEAGAKGRVMPAEIARIAGEKRTDAGLDMPCELAVFAMRDVVLAEVYPEAGQRQRKWMPLRIAAERAGSPELRALIDSLHP